VLPTHFPHPGNRKGEKSEIHKEEEGIDVLLYSYFVRLAVEMISMCVCVCNL
jgi:hypothetical protein